MKCFNEKWQPCPALKEDRHTGECECLLDYNKEKSSLKNYKDGLGCRRTNQAKFEIDLWKAKINFKSVCRCGHRYTWEDYMNGRAKCPDCGIIRVF